METGYGGGQKPRTLIQRSSHWWEWGLVSEYLKPEMIAL